MKSERVSVIMPVYNSEKYLNYSIDSVVNQTYEDWRLYIIDDGSSDGSADIIDRYEKENERITAFHYNNSGVSAARNIGIDLSKGEFLIFIDSDDIMLPDSIAVRMDLIANADIAITNYGVLDSEQNRALFCPDDMWDRDKLLVNVISGIDYGYQGYLWNKIFRKEIIDKNDIRFDEKISYNEDRLFCYLYSIHCNNAKISNTITYMYRKSENSAMYRYHLIGDRDYDKFISEFCAYDKMEAATCGNKELLALIAEDEMIGGIIRKKKIKKSEKRIQKKLNNIIRTNGIKLLKLKKMNLCKMIKTIRFIVLLR